MSSRVTRVLHRSLSDRLPTTQGIAGVEIGDSEGRRYIDASGGAAVSCLRHARGRDAQQPVPAYLERLAQEPEGENRRLDPRTVEAFVAETVVEAMLDRCAVASALS